MNVRQIVVLAVSVLGAWCGNAVAAETKKPYVRIADIEIDGAQLEAYKAAVTEEIEASIQIEPGVQALYAVSDKEDATHITVFEIYVDESEYKAATQNMVRALKLAETVPIALGAKR